MNLHAEVKVGPGSYESAQEILSTLDGMFSDRGAFLALHEPEFNKHSEELVLECIRSSFVSSIGSFVTQFETCLAETCGVKHAVAMVNGTAALEVGLRVVGVKAGSEVLVPSLTFVATPNAVSHLGAIPHFVDANEFSLSIDPDALMRHLSKIGRLKEGTLWNKVSDRPISAIVPVHIFGHPAEMGRILEIANHFEIPVVEDAAEALGSLYQDRPCGSLGRLGALSFNGNKIITTGGGGAVVTDNASYAELARHLSTTAKVPHDWAFNHDEIGYNYRMPNINAALGLSQLTELEDRIAKKRRVAEAYVERFANFQNLNVVTEPKCGRSNYWLNAMLLEPNFAVDREPILQTLNNAGFMARPAWTPMHQLGIYRTAPQAALPQTNELAARIINLPSSAKLAEQLL